MNRNNYLNWKKFYRTDTKSKNDVLEKIKRFEWHPKISILMPVYNVKAKFAERAIESLKEQFYENWELCIADDHSQKPDLTGIFKKKAAEDKRIKCIFLDQNLGISQASNQAAALSSGEFIGFLDHDDELVPSALYEVVRVINKSNPDVIYSDEDFIDKKGRAIHVHFKPDYSPDLLFCHNYITHF
ncbi:MAG: glycosyltransferase, partial [Desulfobacterales bacterium]